MKAYIYGLRSNRSGKILYIGQTINPQQRLYGHLCDHRYQTTKKNSWIKHLIENGYAVEMVILEECAEEDADALEIKYIAEYREKEPDLKNAADGGKSRVKRKLTDDDVREIFNLYARTDKRGPQIGEMFGVGSGHVARILRGEIYPHLFDSIDDETKARIVEKRSSIKALSEETVLEIRRMYKTEKYTTTHLEKLFGIHNATIYGIIIGDVWGHLPGALTKEEAKRTTDKLRKVAVQRGMASDEVIQQVRQDRKNGMPYKELAEKYDWSQGTLWSIVNYHRAYAQK